MKVYLVCESSEFEIGKPKAAFYNADTADIYGKSHFKYYDVFEFEVDKEIKNEK